MLLTQAIIDAVRSAYPDAFFIKLNGFKYEEEKTKWYVTFMRIAHGPDIHRPGAMMVSV